MASNLTRLLGRRAAAALLEDRERAVALNAEFLRTHSYHAGADVTYRWELEVWGAEPWLSAATRALRSEG